MSAHRYSVVVEGELGPRYASAFEGMTLWADSGETAIVGPITDDAHLKGLLDRIAGLGLRLLSLRRLDTENPDADAQPHARLAEVNHNGLGTTSKGP
jgi:hypothetical protein